MAEFVASAQKGHALAHYLRSPSGAARRRLGRRVQSPVSFRTAESPLRWPSRRCFRSPFTAMSRCAACASSRGTAAPLAYPRHAEASGAATRITASPSPTITAGSRTTRARTSSNGSPHRTRSPAAISTRSPQRPAIAKRVAKLLRSAPVQHYDSPVPQAAVRDEAAAAARTSRCSSCCRPTADVAQERVHRSIPTTLDPTGRTTIDFYRPSHDGKLRRRVAVARTAAKRAPRTCTTSRRGKRARRRRFRACNIRPPAAASSGRPTATGFYYTRYPQGGERPPEDRHFYQQVWFHALGTPRDERPLRHRQGLSAHRRDRAQGSRDGTLPARGGAQRRRRRDRVSPARRRRPVDAGRRLHRRRQAAWRSATTATSTR